MTQSGPEDSGRWVDGTLEAGADPQPGEEAIPNGETIPNTETGVGIGAGEPSSFEPEEPETPAGGS